MKLIPPTQPLEIINIKRFICIYFTTVKIMSFSKIFSQQQQQNKKTKPIGTKRLLFFFQSAEATVTEPEQLNCISHRILYQRYCERYCEGKPRSSLTH